MANFLVTVFESVWDKTNNLLKIGLQAGSNLIGKVSIDQTTPGTTNKVYVNEIGSKTDDKDANTDTTSLSQIQLLKYISHILQASMGAYDGEVIDDTNAHTPAANHTFSAINVIGTADVVVNTCTGNPDVSGKTLPLGTSIVGEWSSITFTSGEAIAYQKGS